MWTTCGTVLAWASMPLVRTNWVLSFGSWFWEHPMQLSNPASSSWSTILTVFCRSHGFKCFFGVLDKDVALHGYPEYGECRYTWDSVLMHMFSIVCVGYAVDNIVHAPVVPPKYCTDVCFWLFLPCFSMSMSIQR
jgi:hypothetical protein